MQLVLSTDSTFKKTSFRSSARNKNQIPLEAIDQENEAIETRKTKKV
jgi:hypothetical protein